MMTRINYFSAKEAILIHDIEVIKKIGGLPGVKDEGRVFSVFEHLQNDDYYPDFETKLTVLVYNTVQFHMFNDGNKRSSIIFGIKFLSINNFDYLIPYFIEKMENVVLWVAMGLINFDFLKEIISSILYYEDFSDNVREELAKIALKVNNND